MGKLPGRGATFGIRERWRRRYDALSVHGKQTAFFNPEEKELLPSVSLLPLRGPFPSWSDQAREDSHGGEAISVRRVLTQVHPTTRAQNSHAHAHRGETVSVPFVPECLQVEKATEKTLTNGARLRLVRTTLTSRSLSELQNSTLLKRTEPIFVDCMTSSSYKSLRFI